MLNSLFYLLSLFDNFISREKLDNINNSSIREGLQQE